ncbi:hypothetical protein LOZ53_002886 [Ophidiomyces ophidiicola]|nr:hypothetical protein LOZ55_000275 [Ophidiomyces ophidiicola]KAI1989651.1 hypothetical protein LOZ54_002793 [Ophidiomyces ophidiicola]KAI1991450.1 hypothetical protein LOZ53_002886 [Ophidiomyces ophidiicola]KAI2003601.1 hypothetical protein LOZ51_000683 [Ophidiomyces ophidiicola]
MSELTTTEGRKSAQVHESSFVAFDHAAAGHDGVLCHEDGSLIAKPCTPQEIEFYESSARHPEFRKYMPIFMGTLAVFSEEPTKPATLRPPEVSAALPSSSGADTPLTPELSTHPDLVSIAKASQNKPEWVPSGGRRIETGCSIVLENVAGGFQKPSVLDVKLGARLWDDDAPLSKRERLDEVSRYTTSSGLGFRIAGMKTWIGEAATPFSGERLVPTEKHIPGDANEEVRRSMKIVEEEGYRRYDKYYGRAFNEYNVKTAIRSFLDSAKIGTTDRSKLIAQRIAARLRAMQSMLEKEESRMYSASILIVYEGEPEALERALGEEEEEKQKRYYQAGSTPEVDFTDLVLMRPSQASCHNAITSDGNLNDEEVAEVRKVLDIRLIDFAHARWTPGQGPDENVLQGVRSLVSIMEALANG